MDLSLLILMGFAFLAGFIDSIAGGGGLIQMPALFILAPTLPVPTIMGTNKFAAFSGTALATIKYTRHTTVPWKAVLPAMGTALLFSFLGAQTISAISKENVKVLVLVLLIAVAIYTFIKKQFGIVHSPKLSGNKTLIYSLLSGAALGFYDGFFGPGTGSFLIVIFIGIFGFSFLMASVSAKLVNCATNISALLYFIITNQIIYKIAVPIAICNMTGSYIGSKLAIKKGSAFVRILFLSIVSAMIFKFAWDLFVK